MIEADARTRSALTAAGFGVLTENGVKATMKKKPDGEIPAYRILGACNPKMAHQAIGMEPRVGAMLPCNLILRAAGGRVEMSAIDPVAAMQAHQYGRVACCRWSGAGCVGQGRCRHHPDAVQDRAVKKGGFRAADLPPLNET